MPIARIALDQRLSNVLPNNLNSLVEKLSEIIETGLASERAKPQIIAQSGAYMSGPYLIYVDLQFRASPSRNAECVGKVLGQMASALESQFGCAVRLRAFAIEQATLFALDHQPLPGAA